jgi:hypothetical protein
VAAGGGRLATDRKRGIDVICGVVGEIAADTLVRVETADRRLEDGTSPEMTFDL